MMIQSTLNMLDTGLDAEIRKALFHDFHKLMGMKHQNKHKLSTSADNDAAKMSRPIRLNKPVWPENSRNYRRNQNGWLLYDPGQEIRNNLLSNIRSYYDITRPTESLYQCLLEDTLLSRFNESVDLPFTSLKYHTILVTNLHRNYILNLVFADLRLKIISVKNIASIYDVIFLHTTKSMCIVLADKNQYPDYEAVSNIGSTPMMNFGDVFSRFSGEIYLEDILFSNLRRIKSWSIGLQYLEDMVYRMF